MMTLALVWPDMHELHDTIQISELTLTGLELACLQCSLLVSWAMKVAVDMLVHIDADYQEQCFCALNLKT